MLWSSKASASSGENPSMIRNNFRPLATKDQDSLWIFILPLAFLILMDVVFIYSGLPSDTTSLNIGLIVGGSISCLLTLVDLIYLTIYLLIPKDRILISVLQIAVENTSKKEKLFKISDIEKVTYKAFLSKNPNKITIYFRDKTKYSIYFVSEADKIGKYLEQIEEY